MTITAILEGQDRAVITVTGDMPVADVVALLAEKRIGAVPVVRDGAVEGIISERDILYRLAGDGAAMLSRPVREVMTTPAITVTTDLPVLQALGLMTKRRIRHLPVVEDGQLRGFISIGDLVKLRIDRIEAEALAMRDYIQNA